MSVELLTSPEEFEEDGEHEKIEIEKKYQLINPTFFDYLRQEHDVQKIIQIYLSDPSEPYSLRLRKTITKKGITYTATLKDRGVVTPSGLRRTETPTVINEAVFDAYNNGGYATIYKERIEPVPGVSIDWIDKLKGGPILEIEEARNNDEANLFYQMYQDQLIDKSGHPETSNEAIAYAQSGLDASGLAERQHEPEDIAKEILAFGRSGIKQMVVTIAGRSGSGKTTSIKAIKRLFTDMDIPVATLSTDDYHRGKTFLEQNYARPWTDWDASVVYDTKALAFDIWQLQKGETIEKRDFNFATQEPTIDGFIAPQDIILVEGIHAGSKDLDIVRRLHFEIDTPLATCIGRDLARIRDGKRSSDSIGSTEARLRYQLEIAEPTYQTINKPGRNRWSACARPIGKSVLGQTVIN